MAKVRRAWLGGAILLACVACSSKEGATKGSTSSSASATPAPPATAALTMVDTAGEVETVDQKGKIRFTIKLPAGLKDISEAPYMKSYGLDATKFDGYGFQVMEGKPSLKTNGLEEMAKEAERQKATVLEKEEWNGGWYLAAVIYERGKQAVVLQGMVDKGDVYLSCRGNAEGDVAKDSAGAAKVLADACRSLTVTSE